MLLTQLNETITRRAKTTDELQKLIDASGSSGIEAISSDTVKIVDRGVTLQNIITPGKLPFKFQATDLDISIRVNMPTLRSFHGMEGLVVRDFIIGRLNKGDRVIPSKILTLEGMPKASGKIELVNMTELKSLKGLGVLEDPSLSLNNCPLIETLEHTEGVATIQLMDCKNITFEHFPKSCTSLNIEYLTITRGLPWFIMIPQTCKVKLASTITHQPFSGIELPQELASKIVKYQAEGMGTKVRLLEIQADLIDADLDHLAEL